MAHNVWGLIRASQVILTSTLVDARARGLHQPSPLPAADSARSVRIGRGGQIAGGRRDDLRGELRRSQQPHRTRAAHGLAVTVRYAAVEVTDFFFRSTLAGNVSPCLGPGTYQLPNSSARRAYSVNCRRSS